jgi:hypothetical protein
MHDAYWKVAAASVTLVACEKLMNELKFIM